MALSHQCYVDGRNAWFSGALHGILSGRTSHVSLSCVKWISSFVTGFSISLIMGLQVISVTLFQSQAAFLSAATHTFTTLVLLPCFSVLHGYIMD
jgi:hypothetical protein